MGFGIVIIFIVRLWLEGFEGGLKMRRGDFFLGRFVC